MLPSLYVSWHIDVADTEKNEVVSSMVNAWKKSLLEAGKQYDVWIEAKSPYASVHSVSSEKIAVVIVGANCKCRS